MKNQLAIILVLATTFYSCRKNPDGDFLGQLLDLATRTSGEEYVESRYVQLTNLYDTLTSTLPEDAQERLFLVERLKERGFEITHWGRGNYPPHGPRIVIVELTKENCICEASKIYYRTAHDSLYKMVEGINCRKAK